VFHAYSTPHTNYIAQKELGIILFQTHVQTPIKCARSEVITGRMFPLWQLDGEQQNGT